MWVVLAVACLGMLLLTIIIVLPGVHTGKPCLQSFTYGVRSGMVSQPVKQENLTVIRSEGVG